ncbi:MAG: hypothetical protein KU37_02680 [Sulfuricurvum sp. PC08-66]|nr:MAG: hypothetical protein KU37_02680 [Sulfuricurvum sp. PC08-66]
MTVGLLAFALIFAIDQYIKTLFVEGFRWYSDYIDLILVYNHGVAFGSFAFLAENLKYIQIALLVGVVVYVIKTRATLYAGPVGILLGAGSSNIFDRFIHGGVVDYIFYHHWFDFAVFNFADVMIDVAIVWILLLNYLSTRKNERI